MVRDAVGYMSPSRIPTETHLTDHRLPPFPTTLPLCQAEVREEEKGKERERTKRRGASGERNIPLLVLGPPSGTRLHVSRPARRPSESVPAGHNRMREEACRLATHSSSFSSSSSPKQEG